MRALAHPRPRSLPLPAAALQLRPAAGGCPNTASLGSVSYLKQAMPNDAAFDGGTHLSLKW